MYYINTIARVALIAGFMLFLVSGTAHGQTTSTPGVPSAGLGDRGQTDAMIMASSVVVAAIGLMYLSRRFTRSA